LKKALFFRPTTIAESEVIEYPSRWKGENPMRLTHLLTLNAILFIAFGIAFALYGPLMLAFFGVPEIPENNVQLYWHVASFARLSGAALFGFGFLIWAVRSLADGHVTPQEARRGVVFALLLGNLMGAIVAITQQSSVWLQPVGWAATAIFALLTVGYGYFMVSSGRLEANPKPGE
jgi:hypothetical protein